MSFRYSVHPSAYSLGALEKYYSGMAKKGWMLTKQGGILSKFKREDPSKLQFHVEYVPGSGLKTGITDEQIAAFKDTGWTFIGRFESDYIFSAPENTELPDFELSSEQRSASLKYIRRSNGFTLAAFLIAVLSVIFVTSAIDNGRSFRWAAQLCKLLMEETALFNFCLLVVITSAICAISELWGTHRIYLNIKNHVPLSHAPAGHWRSFKCIQMFVLLLCMAGWCVEYFSAERYIMPLETREPYLLLSETGVSGERTDSIISDESSRVNFRRTIFADSWETKEYLEDGSQQHWMLQDAYFVRNTAVAQTLAKALIHDAVFGDDVQELKIEGLDGAWICSDFECVAIKGKRVIAIASDFDSTEDAENAIRIIAGKWKTADCN